MTNQILKLPDVMRFTGLSRSSIYAFMQEGDFPKSIKLSARSVGWLKEEIDSWLDNRIQCSRALEDSYHG